MFPMGYKFRKTIYASFILALGAVSLMSGVAGATSIVNSKHNLSVSGPGTVKAATESQICIFCHAPHNASGEAPLWNRYDSGQTYIPYTSSTAKATIGQPTGASKLCLSCHDGTVALGMVRSRTTDISFSGGITTMPPAASNLGVDLSDDHPVSFHYDALLVSQNPQLNSPASLRGQVKLDKNGELQCTACHDPHDDQYGNFLAVDAANSGLCVQCHNKTGWGNSPHNLSAKTWNGVLPDPWPDTHWTNVAQNGCLNCHAPHNAGGKERLLRHVAEETNCFVCHDGHVASTNIEAEFNKFSVHPVMNTTGLHDPQEPALVSASRHVECADCHNPHMANDQDGPDLPGSLKGLKGIDVSGAEVNPINHEYELCFRCHADSSSATPYVNRQFPGTNTRLEFNPANASYHPVVAIGKNPNVPSLKAPYTTASMIKCTDCHNNSQGPAAGGTGPRGPHGSDFAPLLEQRLTFTVGTESAQSNALCYKCHDRNSILNNTSFPQHRRHVVNRGFPCTACHDAHGSTNNKYLINFDRNIVIANCAGRLEFDSVNKLCYLNCHGSGPYRDHNPATYYGRFGFINCSTP